METKLIKIGNSKGVRLPSQLLGDFEVNTAFEITREGDSLILTPRKDKRAHWVDQMKKLQANDSDFMLNEFDKNDWTW